jgi:sugar/nucleoside kinase (ribokinase family)
MSMQALFIGQTYIDITFRTDRLPTGDEKHVASEYAVSFGGNAVTAAFCCAKLSIVPDLLTSVAEDWLGRMFLDMAAKHGLPIHPRKVNTSSLSFIMPRDGKRAIVRCRDDDYLGSFPTIDLTGCRALHVDGHQSDAAIYYARTCRASGILTSLDGGGLRSNTHDLLAFIDVAIVAERLCEQMALTSFEMLAYLKGRGCRVGGVTLGERGLLWYGETGAIQSLSALPVPPHRVVKAFGENRRYQRSGGEFGFARLPVPWEELVDQVSWVLGDASEHVCQPSLWIHVVHLCRDDETVHGGCPLSAAIGAGEKP